MHAIFVISASAVFILHSLCFMPPLAGLVFINICPIANSQHPIIRTETCEYFYNIFVPFENIFLRPGIFKSWVPGIKTKALFCKPRHSRQEARAHPSSPFLRRTSLLFSPGFAAVRPCSRLCTGCSLTYIYFSLFSGHALAAIHPSLYCARVRLDIIDESQPRRLPQCTSPRDGEKGT